MKPLKKISKIYIRVLTTVIILKNKKRKFVTFDQNGQNAICADFEFLAASLPDWWLLRIKDVIGTISQTMRAGIFRYF